MARPQLGPEEEAAVLDVMRSGLLAQGRRVKAFEDAFATAMGAQFAVATSNGTTALFLALLAHGIGPGDEVITSPLTFIATANAIVHTGARPVFADVDDSLNLDPEATAAMIGPNTRAIVPVHLHGYPCDLPAFARLADAHGLALIQDACQAVGATIDGKSLGAFGTAVYSFYATKNLTTGEGGMIITNDPSVAQVSAHLRHQAYSTSPYLHNAVGYNFRMTEMQAAIGLVQLQKLPALTQRRRETGRYYDERLQSSRFLHPSRDPSHGHVYHQYTLRMPPDGDSRDALRQNLERAGIGTGVYYPVPVHKQPPYRHFDNPPCPEAERAADDMFSIPVHPALSEDDRARVAQAVAAL
ncbi:MAG: DegT/DnrJ/EryC1/StrS family aminotransferase [Candidatus Dormibacteraeota bacterium]|nr:DegT/DnrJ/EryC1/StrS family aminotransferase [Candidatus Dormibacteraeota bacterium]